MKGLPAVAVAVTVTAVAISTGCRATDDLFCSKQGCEWTSDEWAKLKTLSPLPRPTDDPDRYGDRSNAYWNNDAAIALGHEFYFDPRFSGNASMVDTIGQTVPYARAATGQPINISCATCHDPKRAGADFTSAPNTVSIGAGWYDVNGEQSVNALYYPLLYWNGRSDSLWGQAAAVNESGVSMNSTRLANFWVIQNDAHYHSAYNAVFTGDPLPEVAPATTDVPLTGKPGQAAFDGMTADNKRMVTRVHVNFAKAIGAYEYTLLSRDSAFDKFIEGDETAIPPAAKRGARLFVGKASCIDCHNGPLFSDGEFHDVGVPQVGDHVPTVTDCYPGRTNCDCTPGAEKGTCMPSGAWSGLLKLAAAKDSTDTSGNPVINWNNFRRDSTWSDGAPDQAFIDKYYSPPTDARLKGTWRTPSLRDVAITAPYMHNGLYKTLDDVLWHYNVGGSASSAAQFNVPECAPGATSDPDAGAPCLPADAGAPGRAAQLKPLGLTEDEMDDLIAFLRTLTGAPLPLTQTSKPVPPTP
jgi:cytochrome c peroxidase